MTQGSPLISVLTTVYNRQEVVQETIHSVLNNGFDDFEYIIVDDCSTDNSWDVIQKWASRDSRIRAYRNTKNLGDYPNRNCAATYAQGKYLKYVDSDDLLLRDRLGIFVHAMEKNPSAAYAITAERTQLLSPKETAIRAIFDFKRAIGGAPGNLMMLNESFREVGGFAPFRALEIMNFNATWLENRPFSSLSPTLSIQGWLMKINRFNISGQFKRRQESNNSRWLILATRESSHAMNVSRS